MRTKEVKNITIHNKTAVSWLLNPVIDGEYWSGPVSVAVESGHSAQYELTYKPLVMTKDTQKHQVTFIVHTLFIDSIHALSLVSKVQEL